MHNGRPKVTGARSAFDVHPFHVCRSRPLCYPPCASSAIAVPRVGSLSLVSCMAGSLCDESNYIWGANEAIASYVPTASFQIIIASSSPLRNIKRLGFLLYLLVCS